MWFTWCAPFQVQLFWLPLIFLPLFLPLVHFFWWCGVSVCMCVCFHVNNSVDYSNVWIPIKCQPNSHDFRCTWSQFPLTSFVEILLCAKLIWNTCSLFCIRNWFHFHKSFSPFVVSFLLLFLFFCSPGAAAFQFIKTQIKCSLPESLYVYTLYRVWYVPKTDAGGRERKKRKKELVQRNHLDRPEYGMCCSLVWFDLIQYSFCRASAHKI